MSTLDWRHSAEFGLLCDLVASDYLVCLTGAGISRSLLRHNPPGTKETLPGWVALLRELLAALEHEMSAASATSARRLLDRADERPAASKLKDLVETAITGPARLEAIGWLEQIGPLIGSRELILAASLIRTPNPAAFDRLFRAAITEAPGQCSETHHAILDLLPRGIMTFNYDQAHETAYAGREYLYKLLNPMDQAREGRFGDLISRRLADVFVLKAHGSVDSTAPLVLTTEEYRNLLARRPAYRAFVQNLFTNYHFLMIGYGLDDPDFDIILDTMAEQFADPLQKHVVLRTVAQRHRREEVERLLYGIHTLHVNDFSEIPDLLRAAADTSGPVLQKTLEDCLAPEHARRSEGHAELASLGPAGRALAGRALLQRLGDHESFIVSEAAYSLGHLDAAAHKGRLCDLVDERSESDVLGRTLTVLRGAFTPSDLSRLKSWLNRFLKAPPDGPRPERIAKYLEYLIVYVEHKYQSDP